MALHDAAIVGFAETKIVERSSRDIWELGGEVLQGLLADTGVAKDEIDGLILSSSTTGSGNIFWSQTFADQLGLVVDFAQTVDIGGCSPVGAVARAAVAIDAGFCNVVLCLFADTQAAEDNRNGRRSFAEEWTAPLGYLGPVTAFGMLSTRYRHQFGLDETALAALAVAQRGHAVLNPLAVEKLRKPFTVKEYLDSRMIAEPVRLLDCVMVCDGASGVLVMSRRAAERRGLTRVAVPVGYGERTNHRGNESIVDVTESGHADAGRRAFAQAGIAPGRLGSIHPYDDFIIAIMLQLEMLGFCKPGQGGAFIHAHDFTHAGDLPLNTGGGQISAGQCGLAGGGTNLVEAVRQIFGAAGTRQVRDRSSALVTGIGGIPYGRNWMSSAVMVLTDGG